MQKLLFLDRDGVIIEDVGYLSRINDIVFLEGIHDLIERAVNAKYKVAIITNQSGIARKYFDEQQFHIIMGYIIKILVKTNKSLKNSDISYYYCPHSPDDGCSCRKPKTGLFEACQKHLATKIDWPNSIMVGDRMTDIFAALNMGITNNYLIDGKDAHISDHEATSISFAFNHISALSEVKVRENF